MTTQATFRPRFWPIFLTLNTLGQATNAAIQWHPYIIGPWELPSFVVAIHTIGFGILTGFVVTGFAFGLAHGMGVRVSRAGLWNGGWPSSARLLRWGVMTDVRRFAVPGLPLLQVRVAGRPTVWAPLFLRRMDRFAAFTSRTAGPDHPLTVALAPYRRAD